MQDFVVNTIRASVLLAFLVLVPLAALFGGSRHRAATARKQRPAPNPVVARIASRADEPDQAATASVPALSEQQQRLKVDMATQQPALPPSPLPDDFAVKRTASSERGEPPRQGDYHSSLRNGLATGDDISSAAFDRFRFIQDRLKRLGATYLLLETWDEDTRLYRFCCEAVPPAARGDVRRFETTDADPLVAMNRVLAEVEAWHAAADRR